MFIRKTTQRHKTVTQAELENIMHKFNHKDIFYIMITAAVDITC